MADDQLRPRLGRGLAALIGDMGQDAITPDKTSGQRKVPIEFLRANPSNPRKSFADEDLQDLANSIREKGIIQPILARQRSLEVNTYEIVAGERRWRAAQLAGQHEVPIILIDVDDKQALEIAIVENVQRTDLNALEEAHGYQKLIAEHAYSNTDLSKVIGKSRSHVANTLRLLHLPESVRSLLTSGKITAGHARALLAVHDAVALSKRIVAEGLSVRDVERQAQIEAVGGSLEKDRPAKAGIPDQRDADTRALEQTLGQILGLAVIIHHKGDAGEIKILYKNFDQLEALCKRLGS